MAYDDLVQDGQRYVYTLKVPKDRVAVFIGGKGETKKQLQRELGVRMDVDTQEGEVTVSGDDSLKLYIARDIIKAIARGFNPEIATLLLRQEYVFELIDISDFAGTKDALVRLKGRVIGAQGKSRDNIERMTECYVSVYGKTVGLIGEATRVATAKRAIESLLSGSQHTAVWKFLEKQRQNWKQEL